MAENVQLLSAPRCVWLWPVRRRVWRLPKWRELAARRRVAVYTYIQY
jgi:hypothetical protein